jgi:tRNA A-37 threonylcarbamoyl transferase component Bud32
MNYSDYITLGEVAYSIYSSDKDVSEKNHEFLNILFAVCNKLSDLQKHFGFIHGDFHPGNILITKNGEDILVKFIDFGYSYILIPGTGLTLFVPIDVNIDGDLVKLNLNDNSRAVDMFRLIESFKAEESENPKLNENQYNIFKNFIKIISDKYFNKYKNIKELCKYLKYDIIVITHDSNFLDTVQNGQLYYLFPENFVKFKYNGVNLTHPNSSIYKPNNNTNNNTNFEIIPKSKSLFGNSNNENENENFTIKKPGNNENSCKCSNFYNGVNNNDENNESYNDESFNDDNNNNENYNTIESTESYNYGNISLNNNYKSNCEIKCNKKYGKNYTKK